MTTPHAITWDAVGTLIAVDGTVGLAYADVARRHGISVEAADLDARFPAAFRQAVEDWPVPYGADEDDSRRFWAQVVTTTFPQPVPTDLPRACYDDFARPERWRVLPGVRETLRQIAARGVPQAVVSNFDVRLPALLRDLGLGPFRAVVTSAQVGQAKPAAGPLLAAAKALGVPPRTILHVGDNLREDGGLAESAGCRVLLVRDGIDTAQVLDQL